MNLARGARQKARHVAESIDGAHRFENVGQKWVAVLRFYADESCVGHIASYAGYLSSKRAWGRLSESWWNVISTFGVGEYKASNCEYGHDQFKEWPKNRRDCLTKQVIEIVQPSIGRKRSPVIFGVGATAVRRNRAPTLEDPRPQLTLEELRLSYGFCFQQSLTILIEELDTLEISEDVAIYVDETDHFGYLYKIYQAFRAHRPQLVSMSQEQSVAFAPLQVADLLAYNAAKILYLIEEKPEFRERGRRSLQRLGTRLKLAFASYGGNPVPDRFWTEFIYEYPDSANQPKVPKAATRE